jgi:hypothetical protein
MSKLLTRNNLMLAGGLAVIVAAEYAHRVLSHSHVGFVLVLVGAGIGAYFMPLMVALARKVPNLGSIAVINVFAGWTVIGWVAALAMAVRDR